MASGGLTQGAARKTLAMGPSVRNLLSHYNLDPSHIVSTGPHQILLKSDVLGYISSKNLAPNQLKSQQKATKFTPKLDIGGYQPKPGPEGFSKIAKELLNMK